MNEDYLSHHGILGQKWGKKNGPPYPLDYDQHSAKQKKENPKDKLDNYSDNNPKAKSSSNGKETTKPKKKKSFSQRHYNKLYRQYLKAGYSPEEAALMTQGRIRTEKIMLTAAAVGVAAFATYKIVQKGRVNGDEVIKSGDTLLRVARSGDNSLNDNFFAAKNRLDNKKYIGLYAGGQGGGAANPTAPDFFNKTLEARKDIKIAGKKSAEKEFSNLLKNDPKFKAEWEAAKKELKTYGVFAGNDYDDFNHYGNLQVVKETGNTAFKQFTDALVKKGYGGVKDLNDRVHSGYNTQANIYFNAADVAVKNVEKLTMTQMKKSLVQGQALLIGQAAAESVVPKLSIGLAVGSGLRVWNDMSGTTEIEKKDDKKTKKK